MLDKNDVPQSSMDVFHGKIKTSKSVILLPCVVSSFTFFDLSI